MIKGVLLVSTVVAMCSAQHQPNIVELASETPALSTLVAALKAANLTGALSGPGPFTVFAPSNLAFDALPPGVLQHLLDPRNVKELTDLLLYHVASGTFQAADLKNFMLIKTLEGKNVEVYIRPPFSIYINNARVLTADIEASNGVVHIVDPVIMMPTPPPTPPPTPATLYDVAHANPDLSTFISVIDKAGLTAVLKGGLSHGTNITVYAPTNDAFASLPTADLDYLLNNPGALLSVLTYHVVSGNDPVFGTPGSLVKTVQGNNILYSTYSPSIISRQCPYVNQVYVGVGSECATPTGTVGVNGRILPIKGVLLPRGNYPPFPPKFEDHLYFYYINDTVHRCGLVDAAPTMPRSIFDLNNSQYLTEYIKTTEFYYFIEGMATGTKTGDGTCAELGYTRYLGPGPVVRWALPDPAMKSICGARCRCNYPDCPDVPSVSGPGLFCSLCGPTANKPQQITFWVGDLE